MDSGTWTSFRYFIPPFCVSQGPTNIHHSCPPVYVSAIYPLLPIALTYTCVELHWHNFRPIVWLWKPFHSRCVNIRKGWIQKHPLSMSLPHFSFCFTLSLYMCHCFCCKGYRYNGEPVPITSYVLLTDATVQYLSKEHLHLLSFLFLSWVLRFYLHFC